MMYSDLKIEVKIASANRKHYEKITSNSLTNGELIFIKQKDIPSTSRNKVLCKCDYCNSDFERIRKDVKNNTYCSTKCRNEALKLVNPNLSIDKVDVRCENCNLKFQVHPSKFKKQESFLCSRECYKKHRSKNYRGEKLYNYQNIIVKCSNPDCENNIKLCKYDLENRNNHFCSNECYWKHRKDNYTELYYVQNLFDKRPETIPESKVRKFLEEQNIKYIQEYKLDNYYIDFYLPKYNIAIEVYGDYWHCNPKVFGDEEGKRKIHKNQIKAIEYDKKRNSEIAESVNEIIIIWEYDINNNFNDCMGTVIKRLLSIHP